MSCCKPTVVLLVFITLITSFCHIALAETTSEAACRVFTAEFQTLSETISSASPLARSHDPVRDVFDRWLASPGLSDLAYHLVAAYRTRGYGDLVVAFDALEQEEHSSPTASGQMVLGLLATAFHQHQTAAEAFQQATASQELPLVEALEARAWLIAGSLAEATRAYTAATTAAGRITDPVLQAQISFRVRHNRVQDLLDFHQPATVPALLTEVLQASQYPFEQAWAHERLLDYAVYQGDSTAVADHGQAFSTALETLTSDQASPWEQAVLELFRVKQDYVSRALSGDRRALLMLETWALPFVPAGPDASQLICDRLTGWCAEFETAATETWTSDEQAKFQQLTATLEDAQAALAATTFADNLATVETDLHVQKLADTRLSVGSELYYWRSSPALPDLLYRTVDCYRHQPRAELLNEYETRTAETDGDLCGFLCLDQGLLALALDRPDAAAQALERTRQDPDFAHHPHVLWLQSRALLLDGQPEASANAFLAAVTAAQAIPDPTLRGATLFRIRHNRVQDLLETYQTASLPSFFQEILDTSEYPFEHAWAHERLLDYAVFLGVEPAIQAHYEAFQALLQQLVPHPAIPWEHEVLPLMRAKCAWAARALAGDRKSRLMLDFWVLPYLYGHPAGPQALVDRFAPWIEEFPLEETESWTGLERARLAYMMFHCYAAQERLGQAESAYSGYHRIASAPFPRDCAVAVVGAWGRIGNILREWHELEGAREAYEIALSLDVAEATGATELGLPTGLLQPAVYEGTVDPDLRSGVVANYEHVLRALEENETEAGQ